jgi:hypothetical protein
MGRPPIGKFAMSTAERVRRHRAKRGPVTKRNETSPVTNRNETRLEAENAVLRAELAAALSTSGQEKLDAAIRREKGRLAETFHQAVNDRVREFLAETILPNHRREQAEAKRVMASRKGIMDKATFNKIRRGLHPDSRNSISDAALGAAFDAFMGLEKLLLDEKESPTRFQRLPETMAEWDALKAAATAARKAKRANSMKRR